jgi:hypothetical protein
VGGHPQASPREAERVGVLHERPPARQGCVCANCVRWGAQWIRVLAGEVVMGDAVRVSRGERAKLAKLIAEEAPR